MDSTRTRGPTGNGGKPVIKWMDEGVSDTRPLDVWARHVVKKSQKRVAHLTNVTALPQPPGYARLLLPQARKPSYLQKSEEQYLL